MAVYVTYDWSIWWLYGVMSLMIGQSGGFMLQMMLTGGAINCFYYLCKGENNTRMGKSILECFIIIEFWTIYHQYTSPYENI